MVNYELTKIYQIIPTVDHEPGDVYIGSTTNKYLSQRLSHHVYDYKNNRLRARSRVLFDKYGFENCKIELLESYVCKTKDEASQKEGEWIRKTACVNRCIAGRTQADYKKEHAEKITEYQKQYRETHAEQIADYQKRYNASHVDYYKQYRDSHREQTKKYNRVYRLKKKELKNINATQHTREHPRIQSGILSEEPSPDATTTEGIVCGESGI